MRYFRSGRTTHKDSRSAIEEIYEAIFQEDMALVIFFCTEQYTLPKLANAILTKFGSTKVIGCTSSGNIGVGGYQKSGIVALSFSAAKFNFSLQLIEDLNTLSLINANEIANNLITVLDNTTNNADLKQRFAIQLIDGLSMKEDTVTQLISSALNGIPLVGASAGDDLNLQATFVYHNGEFHTNAAIIALGQTDLCVKPFLIQHFSPSNKCLIVTESVAQKRIVKKLNGLPAAVEYARNIGCRVEDLSPKVFADNPLLVTIGKQECVRSIQRMNDDYSLSFFCAIEDGIVLHIGEPEDIIDNLQTSLAHINASIGQAGLILAFDCILRFLELENSDSLDAAAAEYQANNLFGMCSYGEQYNTMHVNQTMTGLAFSAATE